ncbi:hypothetical protein B0T16DRAFT_494732 [Cercophora newfieldiana]|uniref:Uncharacterized protein n=1 Tax=Cercophora newfieldiana TaxID=92897 RepID=A0AA39Y0Z8_9PEZI|nr:hypothetical protein B0T16DRAFT_494732 [Cercophora newfieldiana]
MDGGSVNRRANSRTNTDSSHHFNQPPRQAHGGARLPVRASTMQTMKDLDDFEARYGWRPGTEPGVDTSRADGGHSTMAKPHAECQITMVDFSTDKINVEELDNNQLIEFLKKPQPDWVQCRWININGLSWDVIKATGQHKKLHRLAVEDLMNTNGRAKADCPNTPRTEFMEEHSALRSRRLAVVAEQVSIFLTSDNTVIAFFESSADDVEVPILTRLTSPSTILRQSCNASLLTQAIMDMAIPDLYILASKVKKMRTFIQPIENIINTIREHKTPSFLHLDHETSLRDLRDLDKGVIITPVTAMYLGDVLDHCLLIRDNLWEITKAADDLIDLVFNTIAAYQNETLKQLTIATIVFLPLTFLTGYFGQNFEPFPELEAGIRLFWQIAAPVVVGTILLLKRDMIYEYLKSVFQRRRISNWRRRLGRRVGVDEVMGSLSATGRWARVTWGTLHNVADNDRSFSDKSMFSYPG